MPDVQIAVRLRRKTRMHAATVPIGLQILDNNVADEIRSARWIHDFRKLLLQQLLYSLVDARETDFASQDFESRKERRGVLAAAYGHANGLKHLAGLDAQFARRGPQSAIQGVMRELRPGERLTAALQCRQRHGRIALLRNEFGGVVGRQLIGKKEIGHRQYIAQQLYALLYQWSNLQHLVAVHLETGRVYKGQQALGRIFDR